MGGQVLPTSLPPLLLLIPSFPFIIVFVLDAFSMSSGSFGRRDSGAWWESFPGQMALGTLCKDCVMMEHEQVCTVVCWEMMMSLVV